MEALRQAWLSVHPADYEQHMANIGQAQANARLTGRWLESLESGAKIIMPGAGPGQMFAHLDPALWAPHELTLTDIQPVFLKLLKQRAPAHAVITEDDIEATRLTGPYTHALIVLVLEHVAWRSALQSLKTWRIENVLVVIQQNPPEVASAVTPGVTVPGTMTAFRDTAHPHLLDPAELVAAMQALGYRLARVDTETVAHGKQMLGHVFIT